jgi:hypothetical protein
MGAAAIVFVKSCFFCAGSFADVTGGELAGIPSGCFRFPPAKSDDIFFRYDIKTDTIYKTTLQFEKQRNGSVFSLFQFFSDSF